MPTIGRLVERIRSVGMTFLGFVLALVPLALWVAWTEIVLIVVVMIGTVSAILLVILSDHGSRPASDEPPGRDRKETLPDDFIAQVHRIFPLTYHHSRKPSARFRETMERLRHMIKGKDELLLILFVGIAGAVASAQVS